MTQAGKNTDLFNLVEEKGVSMPICGRTGMPLKIVTELIPLDMVVGCGDSATVVSGSFQDIVIWGNRVLNRSQPKIMRKNPAASYKGYYQTFTM
jgi:hypothetical protein